MTQTLTAEEPSAPPPASLSPSPAQASMARRVMPVLTTVGVSFAIVALQLAQGILLARLLGPEGRGEYATAILFVQMTLYVGLFGSIEVVCRYAANDNIDRRSLRKTALLLSLKTAAITTAIVFVCNIFGLPGDKKYVLPMALLCTLSIIGQQMTLVLSAVDRGAGDFARYNRIRLIAAAAYPALLLIWAMIGTTTVFSVCALFAIASSLSIVPCFIGLKDQPAVRVAPPSSRLFSEGRPYAIVMLATDLLERLDLFLMLWLAPLVTQGYYTAMLPVAYPLTVIPNTLGLYLFNAGAREGRGLSTEKVKQLLLSSIGFQTVMACGFLMFVGPVVTLVYGTEFQPAIALAMWLAPVSAIKGIVQGLDSYLKGRGQPMATIKVRLLSAAVMLGFIIVMFPVTGVWSIVQGSLVGQIVCCIGLTILVYNDSRANEKLPSIVPAVD